MVILTRTASAELFLDTDVNPAVNIGINIPH
jgi:hypothetical protein